MNSEIKKEPKEENVEKNKNSENKVSDLIKIIMWALICFLLQRSKLKVI